MRVVVLANNRNSFVKPTAQGLERMLRSCGADVELRHDGLQHLGLPTSIDVSSLRSTVSTGLRLSQHRRAFNEFVKSIAGCDVVVVVAHVPASFSRVGLSNIELLRERIPDVPIVNYDLVYLPTVEKWGRAILNGEATGLTMADMDGVRLGTFGMDRYDWYLVVSTASELPMPPGPQPFTRVGIHLDDGSLYPDQQDQLTALVDFAQTRKDYPSYRELQLRALVAAGIPYVVLEGDYSAAAIREIYRKTGIFMLAHRESFGLPICELQACGSLIFAPHAEWAGAHWIKENASDSGPGVHSHNFRIYDNDFETLVAQLKDVKNSFDPAAVVRTFGQSQPELFRGDTRAVAEFLQMVETGAINGASHLDHADVGR